MILDPEFGTSFFVMIPNPTSHFYAGRYQQQYHVSQTATNFTAPPQTVIVAVTGGVMNPYSEGTSVELTCTVTGANPTATIQWLVGGTAVSGATTSPLTISATAESGDYTCEANNNIGGGAVSSTNSETVTILSKLSASSKFICRCCWLFLWKLSETILFLCK